MPYGLDTTGRVKSGSLTLSGLIIPATLFFCSKDIPLSGQYELILPGLNKQGFRADHALSKHGEHFVPFDTTLSVLIAAVVKDHVSVVCLVLRELSCGKFERVGLMALEDNMEGATSFGVLQTITIVWERTLSRLDDYELGRETPTHRDSCRPRKGHESGRDEACREDMDPKTVPMITPGHGQGQGHRHRREGGAGGEDMDQKTSLQFLTKRSLSDTSTTSNHIFSYKRQKFLH